MTITVAVEFFNRKLKGVFFGHDDFALTSLPGRDLAGWVKANNIKIVRALGENWL